MSSESERLAQIRQTRAFVDADYELITLIPRKKQKTSTGGMDWVKQTPRRPQRFHIIEHALSTGRDSRVVGGTQREADMTLLGYDTAVIGKEDAFTHRGQEWRVVELEWDNGYEKRAAVVRFG